MVWESLTAITAAQGFLNINRNGNIIYISNKTLTENFKNEMKKYGLTKEQFNKYDFYTYHKILNMYKSHNLKKLIVLKILW